MRPDGGGNLHPADAGGAIAEEWFYVDFGAGAEKDRACLLYTSALAGLSAREIGALASRWAAFDRAENPSPEDGEERLEGLKKAWSTRPMSAFAGACSNALVRFRRRSGPNR